MMASSMSVFISLLLLPPSLFLRSYASFLPSFVLPAAFPPRLAPPLSISGRSCCQDCSIAFPPFCTPKSDSTNHAEIAGSLHLLHSFVPFRAPSAAFPPRPFHIRLIPPSQLCLRPLHANLPQCLMQRLLYVSNVDIIYLRLICSK